MKVLGLTCGRKVSNTEILVKEVLMGAEVTYSRPGRAKTVK